MCRTDLRVVGVSGPIRDDAAGLGKDSARLVAGRRRSAAQHGQTRPAENY